MQVLPTHRGRRLGLLVHEIDGPLDGSVLRLFRRDVVIETCLSYHHSVRRLSSLIYRPPDGPIPRLFRGDVVLETCPSHLVQSETWVTCLRGLRTSRRNRISHPPTRRGVRYKYFSTHRFRRSGPFADAVYGLKNGPQTRLLE